MYIPYAKQFIDNNDISQVIKVLKSDFLTTGDMINTFENMFAKYVGAKYAVAVSSGTAGLHCACAIAGITNGDEVITSSLTFVASSNAVLYCGGKPVFADIEKKTYNISIDDIKRKITKKTKAIIPVHFAGQPCDMEGIYKIANDYNLVVIEDCAHALGSKYNNNNIGNTNDMAVFSFHPVKHITTGEGGMITTNNHVLYKKLLLFRNHGITRDNNYEKSGDWDYNQLILGYNYRLTDIQCALGISQLDKLDIFINRRTELVERYNKYFKDIKNIILPNVLENCKSSWHLYVIQVDERKKVFDYLRSCGIGINVHYKPVYKQPYYRKIGYNDVVCKNAENIYEKIISLPLYYSLTNDEQDYVIEKVKYILKN